MVQNELNSLEHRVLAMRQSVATGYFTPHRDERAILELADKIDAITAELAVANEACNLVATENASLVKELTAMTAKMDSAIAKERERCAKVAEGFIDAVDSPLTADSGNAARMIAAFIRDGS
jgi:phosphoribosylaminoimidazole carboxylase (NCAIR synthetase)